MPTLQSHTFASRTSRHTSQSLQKSVPVPTQEEFQNIFSSPSKKIKTPDTQTNPTKTEKRSIDNGLQGRWTEGQLITAVWRNGGFSASYDSFVVAQTFVLRMNICGKNRQLLVAANRYRQA